MKTDNCLSINELKDTIKNVELKHIAIIMDGNRRWAKLKALPSILGHKEGVKTLKNIVKLSSDTGLKYLTVYAFSTENWGRKKEEVDFLMFLLQETLEKEMHELHKQNVKIKIIGDTIPLTKNLKKTIHNCEELTSNNTGLKLQIAINYGSRAEITNAVKQISTEIKKGKLEPEAINEELISKYLYTSTTPDPDLLIRTGGEKRISNYLLWQIAYSELHITEAFWPEFEINEYSKAILNFANRNRRYGKDS